MNVLLGMVLVLGILILVHEWGHFAMARLFGVRVDVFSIGFGPRLFGWKWGDTDYRVSALPLGGYVRMAGQDTFEVDSGDQAPTGKPDELMSKPRWQRALISFGGPFVNLVFPILLLVVFYVAVGQPYAAVLDRQVQVVALPAGTTPESTPLHVGDSIVSLNGLPNPTWEKAFTVLSQAAPGSTLQMEVENNGVRRSVSFPVKEAQDFQQFQQLFGYTPEPALIGEVDPAKPAYHAGLRDGDKIIGLNGQPIVSWMQFVEGVQHSNGQKLTLRFERSGQVTQIDVTPQQGTSERGETVWQVGVQRHEDDIAYRPVGLVAATRRATLVTVSGIDEVLGVVAKLFTGRVSVNQLQGVVSIARMSGQAVRQGVFPLVSLMVMISINLGVLNLLPIPILDGGHILLLSIEGLRRRDLSLAFKERFVQVGFVFLLVLFAIVMYHDVARIHLAR